MGFVRSVWAARRVAKERTTYIVCVVIPSGGSYAPGFIECNTHEVHVKAVPSSKCVYTVHMSLLRLTSWETVLALAIQSKEEFADNDFRLQNSDTSIIWITNMHLHTSQMQ